MENAEIIKRNDELFTELTKYPESSKEYRDVVSDIVKNNVRLVTYAVKKYFPMIKSTTLSNDDLKSEGYFGLLNAIQSYQPEKGTFANFAVPCIRSHISKYLDRELKREADSLEDDQNGDKQKPEDTLASPFNLEEDIVKKDETQRQMTWLRKKLDQLSPLQKKVLIARYLSGDTILTGDALAEEFECTQQNISSAENKAIKKLRTIYNDEAKMTREERAEKIKTKQVLKNLIMTELPSRQKKTMLCKFYSATKRTDEQVAQEVNLTKNSVSVYIRDSYKKLRTLCDSIKDTKHLKSILEFGI